MSYRFFLVCPKCNKQSEAVAEIRIPSPDLNCGDCLMDRVEVVRMKVIKMVEQEQ